MMLRGSIGKKRFLIIYISKGDFQRAPLLCNQYFSRNVLGGCSPEEGRRAFVSDIDLDKVDVAVTACGDMQRMKKNILFY